MWLNTVEVSLPLDLKRTKEHIYSMNEGAQKQLTNRCICLTDKLTIHLTFPASLYCVYILIQNASLRSYKVKIVTFFITLQGFPINSRHLFVNLIGSIIGAILFPLQFCGAASNINGDVISIIIQCIPRYIHGIIPKYAIL